MFLRPLIIVEEDKHRMYKNKLITHINNNGNKENRNNNHLLLQDNYIIDTHNPPSTYYLTRGFNPSRVLKEIEVIMLSKGKIKKHELYNDNLTIIFNPYTIIMKIDGIYYYAQRGPLERDFDNVPNSLKNKKTRNCPNILREKERKMKNEIYKKRMNNIISKRRKEN